MFHNINLRGAQLSAIDFGGATFSCMNTGEDRPRQPVVFKNIEFHDCEFVDCSFAGARITGADLTGMTIDGISVSEMLDAYKTSRSAP